MQPGGNKARIGALFGGFLAVVAACTAEPGRPSAGKGETGAGAEGLTLIYYYIPG